MNKYVKLGKNISYITIGNFASKILSFFMVPFYTAVLTTNEFGVADLMTTTVNLLMPFFTLLVSEALLRFSLDKAYDKTTVCSTGLALLLIGTSVFFVFSPIIFLFKSLSSFYILFALYYVATAFHSAIAYFARGVEQVKVYSIAGVFHTFTFILLNILFLTGLKIGVTGYLLSMILSSVISSLYLILGARLYNYVNFKKIDKKLVRDMLLYSVPLIPNALSWWISNSSDKYLLTFICGISVTGIYSVSQRIPSLFATVSTIFMGAWQISAYEDFGSEESRKFFSNVYRFYSSANILMVSFLICFTKPLSRLLFSNDFYIGWQFVPVLLIAFLFHSMSSFLGTVYTSAKKTKQMLYTTLIGAILNIVFNAALIPWIGAQGAAIATLLSYFIIWLIRLINSRELIKLDLNIKLDIASYIVLLGQSVLILSDAGFIYEALAWGMISILFLINKNEMAEPIKKILYKFKKRVDK